MDERVARHDEVVGEHDVRRDLDFYYQGSLKLVVFGSRWERSYELRFTAYSGDTVSLRFNANEAAAFRDLLADMDLGDDASLYPEEKC